MKPAVSDQFAQHVLADRLWNDRIQLGKDVRLESNIFADKLPAPGEKFWRRDHNMVIAAERSSDIARVIQWLSIQRLSQRQGAGLMEIILPGVRHAIHRFIFVVARRVPLHVDDRYQTMAVCMVQSLKHTGKV